MGRPRRLSDEERKARQKLGWAKYNTSEKNRLNQQRYYQANRERLLAKCTVYVKNNSAKHAALERKRQAAKLQATPKWLTADQLKLIEMQYQLAAYLTQETGIRWEVDHIIPLRGKTVRGLHVPWNLRVITKSENCSKNCRVG
jgi:hypothetical protein